MSQGYLVGIDRGALDKHKKPLYLIVKGLEYGAAERSPKPLFTPIARGVFRDLSLLFEDFVKEGLS